MWCRLLWIFTLILYVSGMPKPPLGQQRKTRAASIKIGLADAAKYLNKYGYVSKSATTKVLATITSLNPSALAGQIRRFQKMAGIRATGRLDERTMEYMQMSRCGVEDTAGAFSMGSKGYNTRGNFEGKRRRKHKKGKNRKGKARSRTKRYDLQGSKWSKRELTYIILNTTSDMTKSQIRTAIRKAFKLWADASSLKFRETKDPNADIKISFGRQYHGDDYAFDGTGGTLAHAFFPESGEAHFDDDELFSDRGQGTNLHIVAAHEFGHSLGLGHSTVPNSLMAPFYQGYVADFDLHPDDVAAIQQLYGKNVDENVRRPDEARPTKTPVTPIKPTKKPRENLPDLCNTNIDAIMQYYTSRNAITYAFKGGYYYKLDDDGIAPGYPKKIGQRWKKLPGNLNAAAHSRLTGYTYFFKGNRVYSYAGTKLRTGFPKMAKDMGLPSRPTAVLTWGYDGKMYVFKKKTFVQFDDTKEEDQVSRSRHISRVWRGVPEGIGSAVTWSRNGRTYFFKGNNYWRFNDRYRTVDQNFPQNLNRQWLGCTKKTDVSRLKARGSRKPSASRAQKKNPGLARLEEPPRKRH